MWGPDLLDGGPQTASPRDPAQLAADDGRNDLVGIDWRPRGDLVGNGKFVERALARIREVRPEVSRLYFAGRLADDSSLVLAGTDVRRGVVATAVHSLWVPPGGIPRSGQVREADPLVNRAQVLGWLGRSTDGSVVGVAITRPAPVRFEVSRTVTFRDSDGWTSRTWLPLAAKDGVAVLDLGTEVDPAVGLRAAGVGAFSVPLLVRVEPRVQLEDIRVIGTTSRAYAGPPLPAVRRALLQQVGTVADLRTGRVRVLWSGAPWKQRPLALLLVETPEGKRFQALVGQQQRDEFAAGVRLLPEDAPDESPWLLEPFSSADPTLLLCPTGEGTLVYRRDGQPPRTLPVRADGVAALVEPASSAPSARGADITLLDPAGAEVLRLTLPRHGFDDPVALH